MYGQTLRAIRQSKNYAQKDICQNKFTQATYSNFEKSKSDLTASNLIHVLDTLNMTLEELRFIENGFNFNESEQLSEQFFKLHLNAPEQIKPLLREMEAFLLENPKHQSIQELKLICEALITLWDDEDITTARKKVQRVWNRISKYDDFYLADIRLMNAILFVFEFDSAIHIFETLKKNLNKYKGFQNAESLMILLRINFSLICIKNKDYNRALAIIMTLQNTHLAQLSFMQYAVCLNRYAICLHNTNQPGAASCIEKRNTLLDLYNQLPLIEHFEREYNKYAL